MNYINEIINSISPYLYLLIIIIFILITFYNKIKYECLLKACEMIASVEENKELSGEEKFNLAIVLINQALPSIFKNALFQNVIKFLVQYAYDNSSEYMKNYVKRKTGLDVSEVINQINSSNTIEENNDKKE